MPWVEFTDSFNFTPSADRRSTTAFKAGHKVLVTTECARAAKEAGKAKSIPTPRRGEAPAVDLANPVREI